jgi:catechol 2,3-dioxygenase-like lactoylglutathione lyase family enzyme
MINEANVTAIVNDMERAVKFYTEALGLRVKARYGD